VVFHVPVPIARAVTRVIHWISPWPLVSEDLVIMVNEEQKGDWEKAYRTFGFGPKALATAEDYLVEK
jgi:hypothetical protein